MPLPGVHVVEEAAEAMLQATPNAPASSKLAWATQFLVERAQEHKVAVFSHSVRLLELLAVRLLEAGVRCVRLRGDMSAGSRKEEVVAFQRDLSVRVVLCSIRVAGVGITLTSADTVLLLDPWWNKPVEDQAIDRVHRIGQVRPVEVVRLVARDTVEEQMLAVQDLKHCIFQNAMSRRSEDVKLSRLDVVMKIFRGPWAASKDKVGKQGTKRRREIA